MDLYPKDFTLLNHNEGLLYKIIGDKQTYISKVLEQQEQKILEIQKKIETIENSERPLSLKELRTVYLYQILKHITLISVIYQYFNVFLDSFQLQCRFSLHLIIQKRLQNLSYIL